MKVCIQFSFEDSSDKNKIVEDLNVEKSVSSLCFYDHRSDIRKIKIETILLLSALNENCTLELTINDEDEKYFKQNKVCIRIDFENRSPSIYNLNCKNKNFNTPSVLTVNASLKFICNLDKSRDRRCANFFSSDNGNDPEKIKKNDQKTSIGFSASDGPLKQVYKDFFWPEDKQNEKDDLPLIEKEDSKKIFLSRVLKPFRVF